MLSKHKYGDPLQTCRGASAGSASTRESANRTRGERQGGGGRRGKQAKPLGFD